MTASAVAVVVLCGISCPFGQLSPTRGQIAYVLLTRAPLYSSRRTFAFDLHVLSPPLTFALSQDQTLQLKTESVCSGLFLVDSYDESPEGARHRGSQREVRCSSVWLYPTNSAGPPNSIIGTRSYAESSDSVFKDRHQRPVLSCTRRSVVLYRVLRRAEEPSSGSESRQAIFFGAEKPSSRFLGSTPESGVSTARPEHRGQLAVLADLAPLSSSPFGDPVSAGAGTYLGFESGQELFFVRLRSRFQPPTMPAVPACARLGGAQRPEPTSS